MAKPNYNQQKKQKELARQARQNEKLKKRQEQLEQEKRDLEELRRKHDDFDRGKREMTDHLKRSLLGLDECIAAISDTQSENDS